MDSTLLKKTTSELLMLSTLSKNFSRQHYLFLPEKGFDISSKLSPMETAELSSAELAHMWRLLKGYVH